MVLLVQKEWCQFIATASDVDVPSDIPDGDVSQIKMRLGESTPTSAGDINFPIPLFVNQHNITMTVTDEVERLVPQRLTIPWHATDRSYHGSRWSDLF